MGGQTFPSQACENLLFMVILFLSDIGFAMTKIEILVLTRNYLVESNQTDIFTERWYYSFIKRHDDKFLNRVTKSCQSIRATMTQPEIFSRWFNKGSL